MQTSETANAWCSGTFMGIPGLLGAVTSAPVWQYLDRTQSAYAGLRECAHRTAYGGSVTRSENDILVNSRCARKQQTTSQRRVHHIGRG